MLIERMLVDKNHIVIGIDVLCLALQWWQYELLPVNLNEDADIDRDWEGRSDYMAIATETTPNLLGFNV